jgi:hypothetical protein
MEHPFINNLDDLTLEQLGSKDVPNFTRNWALPCGLVIPILGDQIRMALDSYTTKQQEKTAELYKPKGGEDAFDSKIDIS